MEDIIKSELDEFSNLEFVVPSYRKLNVPRYNRNSSFSELSNWTNSDKVATTKLPRISSHMDNHKNKLKASSTTAANTSACCPIKQMDINLQPLHHDEESSYCKYLKNKNKLPLRQIEFIACSDKDRRKSHSYRSEVLSVGKLKQIIKRKKASQYDVNIEDYLRTTQLRKDIINSFHK